MSVSQTHLYGQMLFLYECFYSFEYDLETFRKSVKNVFVLFTG